MADLMTIRTAIMNTLQNNIPGIKCYRTVPENALVLPAIIVTPVSADFVVAMGRGTDTNEFVLMVLVPYNELETAQHALDPYVSGSGEKSIRQVIFNNRDLGHEGWNATITAMHNYGERFKGEYQGRAHEQLGAVLDITVYTRGDS